LTVPAWPGTIIAVDDVVDERLAGACHVFFVRSRIAHARIRSVDARGTAGDRPAS
jgi:carbon-monoxide dehydrogenase large subunit